MTGKSASKSKAKPKPKSRRPVPVKRGRRSLLSDEITTRLVQALSVGATHRMACEFAGISHETFYVWIARGEANEPGYAEFADRIKGTEGGAGVGWLAKIEKAANEGNWQAAAWKLERRYPQEYGRTVQEHTGPNGGPLQIEMVRYGDDSPAV